MHNDQSRWQTIKDAVKKAVGKENETDGASRRFARDWSPSAQYGGEAQRARKIDREAVVSKPSGNPNLEVQPPTIKGHYDKGAQSIGVAANQLAHESKLAQQTAQLRSKKTRFDAAKAKHDYGMDSNNKPIQPPRRDVRSGH